MRRVALIALAASGVIAAPAGFLACSGDGIAVPDCGMIPEGGCPQERGGTCDDPACVAVYACVVDSWQLAESCPGGGQGGGGQGGGGQGGQGGSGQGGCADVSIDKTGETIGCTPDLQRPDCPVVAAETCHPCETGCVDFFLCTAEGWNAVAYCDQEGQLIVE